LAVPPPGAVDELLEPVPGFEELPGVPPIDESPPAEAPLVEEPLPEVDDVPEPFIELVEEFPAAPAAPVVPPVPVEPDPVPPAAPPAPAAPAPPAAPPAAWANDGESDVSVRMEIIVKCRRSVFINKHLQEICHALKTTVSPVKYESSAALVSRFADCRILFLAQVCPTSRLTRQ
jgi:hypothetical protein